MPSYQWARSATDLKAVSKVAEAEQALCEAVDSRLDKKWAKDRNFRESAEKNVRTALHNLADTYLECRVAADEQAAGTAAGRALGVITRRIRTSSASSGPVSR